MGTASLQRRLHLGLTLSLVLLMGLLWLAGDAAVRRLSEDFITSRLQHDAESLLAAMKPGADGPWIGQGRVNPVFRRPFSGHYYVVRLQDGTRLRSRSLWDADLEVAALPMGQERRWYTDGPSGQHLLVWAAGYDKAGRRFTVAVAEDMTPLEERSAKFQWTFAGLALAGLLGLLTVQSLVLRSAFRRLDVVREDIRRLERGEVETLSERVPGEILPLVRELNHLLVLMAGRLQRSRHALSNLAHALKAPLTLIQQDLDQEQPVQRGRLQAHARRIHELMERELRRARLAGTGAPGQRFCPSEELPDLVEVLRRVHRDKALAFELELPEEPLLHLDREDMLELLGNLLDNACKWGRSRVRVSIVRGASARLQVEDDGPGVASADLVNLSRRGVRMDEQVQGHGLGLAIARDIVELYDGHLAFDRSPQLGGLRVTVSLPCPTGAAGEE